jgi:predicted  nucleic acid-binding Zn-ribbon protein
MANATNKKLIRDLAQANADLEFLRTECRRLEEELENSRNLVHSYQMALKTIQAKLSDIGGEVGAVILGRVPGKRT